MKYQLILISFLAFACQKNDGVKPTYISCEGEPLNSVWVSLDLGFVVEIDLTQTKIGESSPGLIKYDKAKCSFNVNFNHSCSGQYSISNAQYIGGGQGDPNCELLNGSHNFNIKNDHLTFCLASSCGDYKYVRSNSAGQ